MIAGIGLQSILQRRKDLCAENQKHRIGSAISNPTANQRYRTLYVMKDKAVDP